jgi:hypothetical protein
MKKYRCVCPKSIVLLSLATLLIVTALYGKAKAVSSRIYTGTSFSTHTSGKGANFITIGISPNGNLQMFETPARFVHTFDREGYVVCSASGVHGYDLSGGNRAGFGSPVIAQPNGPHTFPLTITRSSEDGAVQLTQEFAWTPQTQEVRIVMQLTNTSDTALSHVRISRYFNGVIDAHYNAEGIFDDIPLNRFARNADSVWGWHEGDGKTRGLMLTALSLTLPHSTHVEDLQDWWMEGGGFCRPYYDYPTPTDPGMWVGRVTHNVGTIEAGSTKTVKVLYRRF